MAIIAENNGGNFPIMEAGNYLARCYQMVQIGTVEEEYKGQKKSVPKAILGFEFPTELNVFTPEKGEQPYALSKEFTLFMNDKANLRKFLESWRGKGFSEEEAKKFDISVLIGKPCMINVIHKENSSGNMRAIIQSVAPLTKGVTCPPQINPTILLSYDNFDNSVFEALPNFIKEKMEKTPEYKKIMCIEPEKLEVKSEGFNDAADDLPF